MRTAKESDEAIAVQAEAEAEAQLKIVRAMKPLDHNHRRRVFRAVEHLLTADNYVEGVLDAFLRGSKP